MLFRSTEVLVLASGNGDVLGQGLETDRRHLQDILAVFGHLKRERTVGFRQSPLCQ